MVLEKNRSSRAYDANRARSELRITKKTYLAKFSVNFGIGLVGDVALAPLAVADENVFDADRLEHADGDAACECTLVLVEDILRT
jgi:uncharacterized protein with von Willebrand factor type A (vWA) domain